MPSPLPTALPSPLPTALPTPVPTPAPTYSPTATLRGYQNCFCLTEQWIRDLNVYCPSLSKHFDEGCTYNMTTTKMQSFFDECPPLRTEFFEGT